MKFCSTESCCEHVLDYKIMSPNLFQIRNSTWNSLWVVAVPRVSHSKVNRGALFEVILSIFFVRPSLKIWMFASLPPSISLISSPNFNTKVEYTSEPVLKIILFPVDKQYVNWLDLTKLYQSNTETPSALVCSSHSGSSQDSCSLHCSRVRRALCMLWSQCHSRPPWGETCTRGVPQCFREGGGRRSVPLWGGFEWQQLASEESTNHKNDHILDKETNGETT